MANPRPRTADEIQDALAAPFYSYEVEALPQIVKGNRALCVFYVDAVAITNRLDAVVGIANWQDRYRSSVTDDECITCKLSVRLDGEWITKSDSGGPSGNLKDKADRRKSAFTDALKRASVKWGIGRYLRHIPQQWQDYDPQRKQFVRPPVPPTKFLPEDDPVRKGRREAAAAPTADPEAAADQLPMDPKKVQAFVDVAVQQILAAQEPGKVEQIVTKIRSNKPLLAALTPDQKAAVKKAKDDKLAYFQSDAAQVPVGQ